MIEAVAEDDPQKEGGTLLMAALLVLCLAFAGAWVVGYVSGDGRPWELVWYFAIAASGVVAAALIAFTIRR